MTQRKERPHIQRVDHTFLATGRVTEINIQGNFVIFWETSATMAVQFDQPDSPVFDVTLSRTAFEFTNGSGFQKLFISGTATETTTFYVTTDILIKAF